jgi:hypothetical protein
MLRPSKAACWNSSNDERPPKIRVRERRLTTSLKNCRFLCFGNDLSVSFASVDSEDNTSTWFVWPSRKSVCSRVLRFSGPRSKFRFAVSRRDNCVSCETLIVSRNFGQLKWKTPNDNRLSNGSFAICPSLGIASRQSTEIRRASGSSASAEASKGLWRERNLKKRKRHQVARSVHFRHQHQGVPQADRPSQGSLGNVSHQGVGGER